MTDDGYMAGFLARVKAWMATSGIEGEPTSLTAQNNEWAGSTEEGFHDELVVMLHYRVGDLEESTNLNAADQESLWKHVIPRT